MKGKIVISDPMKYSVYDPTPGSKTGFQVAFCSSPKDGRALAVQFNTCRDYMHQYVQAHIHAKAGKEETSKDFVSGYIKGKNPPIDLEHLRLVMAVHTDGKPSLFAVKRVLNHFEKMAGFKESKITSALLGDKQHPVFLLTGPRQWMSHPALLSVVTLLMRAGMRAGIENEKNISKAIEKIMTDSGSDSAYAKKCLPVIPVLMKNYKQLFDDPVEEAYPRETKGWFHGEAGIYTLCQFKSTDHRLNEKLENLLKKKEK